MVFKGSYTQYKAYQLNLRERDKEVQPTKPLSERQEKDQDHKPSKGKTISKYEMKKLHRRQSEIETKLQTLEEQLAVISGELENPPSKPETVLELGEQYVDLQAQIDALTSEWGDIEGQLGES